MKVYLASYQAVSLLHGGPNTQLRMTARHLPENGIAAGFFDPWSRFGREDADLFHLFAANIGTYHLAREIHALGMPLVVSPIIYSLHSHRFVLGTLTLTRLAQRMGKGIWTDYALAADICHWASLVLPNSGAERDFVIHGLGIDPGKVHAVPNGVEERFASGDPTLFTRKYGLENFILNVGHIGHERKNVLSLIKALGRIQHPSVIIGRVIRSPYGNACVQEARKHKQILLIDGLDHDSEVLASAYAACDVFVLPSIFETPGIAALEAGLAGAKVVITDHGGPREYFGNMATYVDPRSVDRIEGGIRSALQEKKTERLREHIRKEYLWSAIARKTAALYREVPGAQPRI